MRHDRDREPDVDVWPRDAANALELFEFALAQSRNRSPHEEHRELSLRDTDWGFILQCARAGVRKGAGRGGRRSTRGERLVMDGIILSAQKKKLARKAEEKAKPLGERKKVTGTNSITEEIAEWMVEEANRRGLRMKYETALRYLTRTITPRS
jgi:hypothetical protein